ncbi:MAG: HAMP domain-containing histidine kinase [Pirellulales bacterium]|nr:HAMP domain-containing histidine kinase [Pirellulales bacterium]
MKRQWHVWVIFFSSLIALLGGLSWITVVALDLDAAEQQAQARGQWEEDVRLALWRMDSYLTTMISAEASRPYFVYSSAYPPYRAYAHMFSEEARSKGGAEPLLMPSPLLLATPPHVKLHFQATPGGEFSSPQSPTQTVQNLVNGRIATPERWVTAHNQLEELRLDLNWDELQDFVPDIVSPTSGPLIAASGGPDPPQTGVSFQSDPGSPRQQRPTQTRLGANSTQLPANLPPQQFVGSNGRSRGNSAEQQAISQMEFYNRLQGSQNLFSENSDSMPISEDVRASVMSPAWFGDRLFLLRRVEANGDEYIQGVWLNWRSLRGTLLGLVADIFPNAQLSPVAALSSAGAEGSERMLAVLPARLLPGEIELPPLANWTPIRIALASAWLCMLLAAAAVAALLTGVLRLSERRAAFVSAVTHELRTPLTTFRMYSEMLSSGMVDGEERQNQYLDTLRLEADRLGHLVENVLSFARLERTRATDRSLAVEPGDIMAKIEPRLRDRAARSEMELEVVAPERSPERHVKAEAGAVEQILLNLVDNACKYASSARPGVVRVEQIATDAGWEIRVCDQGPGISKHESRTLFRPFTKSASEAAHSAPGVGLGLALSRRLAREMRGELRLDHAYSQGACFVLLLPWA